MSIDILISQAARDLMTYVAESFRFDLRSPSTDMIVSPCFKKDIVTYVTNSGAIVV